jgi:threonine aldolase
VTQRLHDPDVRGFGSDNHAGVHPEVLTAIAEANGGHQPAYGADVYTERLRALVREHFGETAQTFPVFGGTGANVVALQSMVPRWAGVVCASSAHIHTDENGAPERVAGLKLLTVPTPDGKLTPELIDEQAWGWGDEHRAQPLALSITQTTELGTLYTAEQLREVCAHAHSLGMRVHMDGTRVANAAAALDVPLRALTTDVGVDVLSLGGTKNGLIFGEAIVVLDPDASEGIGFLRKMDMQLASKMRFVSAQLIALLSDELWLRNARHANAMAARLRSGLEAEATAGRAPGLGFLWPTESNAVFASLPAGAGDRIRESFRFYDWDAAGLQARWMCAWDTTEDDVDAFVAAVSRVLSS